MTGTAVGLRVMGTENKNALRCENRLAGADANPYLIHAATLAAGLWGIENQVEPTEKCEGKLWDKMDTVPDWQMLPTRMEDAMRPALAPASSPR